MEQHFDFPPPHKLGVFRHYERIRCRCRPALRCVGIGAVAATLEQHGTFLSFCADIGSVLFRLRDQPCPTILKSPYRSCVSK